MIRLAAALVLVTAPALAQTNLSDCQPIGRTAGGEMVYGLDCKAFKAENASPEYKPPMAPTTMRETVIPKSGKTQTPETTPTTGVNK